MDAWPIYVLIALVLAVGFVWRALSRRAWSDEAGVLGLQYDSGGLLGNAR